MLFISKSNHVKLLAGVLGLLLFVGLGYVTYGYFRSVGPPSDDITLSEPAATDGNASSTDSGVVSSGPLTPSGSNLPSKTAPPAMPSAGKVTITGTMLCLPHRGDGQMHTLECAYGLQDQAGRYYGLRDTDPMYKNISGVPMNTLVVVKGELTLKEDTKYQSIGVIAVEGVTVVK